MGFARSLGFALLPLAVCCIMANILLFFPGGEIQYVQQERLSRLIWFMMGIGGGGVLVSSYMSLYCYYTGYSSIIELMVYGSDLHAVQGMNGRLKYKYKENFQGQNSWSCNS